MPVASADVWKVLYTVSRYLFPVLAVTLVFLVLFFILYESRIRREKVHNLPGSGTVGELIVLSGSRDLDANTWFPVPREGVLGSVRSCDLVIPCPGVHTKHLDFSWEDGTGLLIRPRTGCEVQINGVPVTCRTHAADVPLTHGAVLQVGSALLRLHLFAALDSTVSSFRPLPEERPSFPGPSAAFVPDSAQSQYAVPPVPYDQAPVVSEFMTPSVPYDRVPTVSECTQSESPFDPSATAPESSVSDQNAAPPLSQDSAASSEASPATVRRRRSDRWKEDLGE